MPKTFQEKVLKIVRNIKSGSTMSYDEVATKAGQPRAARAVGNIMAKNQDISVPCHRVIRSDGSIGPYNGLRGNKEELLKKEGAI